MPSEIGDFEGKVLIKSNEKWWGEEWMNDLEEWLLLLTKISSLPPEFWVINTPLLRKVWDFFIVCKHIFHRFDDSGTSYIILISNLPKEVIFKPKYFWCHIHFLKGTQTFWHYFCSFFSDTFWQDFHSVWKSLKMSHLSIWILAFPTIFCLI